LERFGIGLVAGLELLGLGGHKDRGTIRLIRQIRKERKSLLTAVEAFLVYSIARAQSKRDGVMAEVGVFEGASARLLCESKGERCLHLFDTFDGLPKGSEADRFVHKEKQYACSEESVSAYLADYDNVVLHKGRFPESARNLDDCQYSFVHFDVDLYESTLACLEYFYPKMIPGGIMLSHDYSILAGVKAAFEEFLVDKPEALIDLPSTQCMLVKLPEQPVQNRETMIPPEAA